jgi:hypothetical protein
VSAIRESTWSKRGNTWTGGDSRKSGSHTDPTRQYVLVVQIHPLTLWPRPKATALCRGWCERPGSLTGVVSDGILAGGPLTRGYASPPVPEGGTGDPSWQTGTHIREHGARVNFRNGALSVTRLTTPPVSARLAPFRREAIQAEPDVYDILR